MSTRMKGKVVLIIGLVFFALFPYLRALATVTVAPATGGSAISADTTGGTYTSLTGPVITEGATGDIGGNDDLPATIILNVPSGFIFDTGGTAPTVLVTRTAGSGGQGQNINSVASGTSVAVTSRTTTQITFTVTSATQNNVRNSLTWQNVRVRPSAGTPLASGNITTSGTLTVAGVTNGTTNFGTLTEVVGAKSQLVITTQPSTSATTATDFGIKPIVAVRDQFGNTITSDNATTITSAVVLSTQICGGTAGTGTLTSTPASGAAVSSGLMTYTAMQYSAAESIKICFSSSGITSALSNAVTVSAASSSPAPPSPPPSSPSAPSPAPTASPSLGGSAPSSAYISGQAYPGSKIEILRRSEIVGQYESVPLTLTSVKDDGTFQISIQNFLQSGYFFALRATDKDGRQSRILPLISQFVLAGSNLVSKDIFIPPTMDVILGAVPQGQPLKILGYAAPSSTVEVSIDDGPLGQTTSDGSGLYTFATSTASFSFGNHTIKARFVSPNGAKSDFSFEKVFKVSPLAFPKTDLDGDGVVNIKDWSIFLFRWGSSDAALKASIDFNGDGKVDIVDFSIFLESMRIK